MTSTDRVLLLVILSFGVALACASPGGGASPQACDSKEQCSATARCIEHACVENRAPIADFTAPTGDLFAGSAIALDASASSDLDTGDAITSYKWEVAAGGTPTPECQPPTISSTDERVSVVFGCAGDWDVKLVVYDGDHAASAVVTKTVTVKPPAGPAVIAAGSAQTFDHYCSGSPLKCTTAVDTTPTAVQLSAALNSEASLKVRWSVAHRPTGRDAANVQFDDAASLTPKVVIATDGSAISGDWVFRVEALNGADVIGFADTSVSVGNRPPAISHGTVGEFPHKYDSISQLYSASGLIVLQITDPDGDTVTSEATRNQTNAGSSTFDVILEESNVSFSIASTKPSWLRGSPGLARTINVTTVDANGAAVSTTLPVVVENRPPTSPGSYNGQIPHRFDAAKNAYVSTFTHPFWNDPEGDPMAVSVTGASDCTAVMVPIDYGRSNGISVTCTKPFNIIGDLAGFIGPRNLTATVVDSFGDGPSALISLQITDRAPRLTASTTETRYTTCSWSSYNECDNLSPNWIYGGTYESFTANLFTTQLVDDDGDPMQVTPQAANASGSACLTGSDCWIRYTFPKLTHVCAHPLTSIPFTANDGFSPAQLSLTVQTYCR